MKPSLTCILSELLFVLFKLGFKEQLYNIFKYIPEKSQVAIFSATYTKNDIIKFIINDRIV